MPAASPSSSARTMARFTGMPLRPARFPGPAPTQPISRSSSHRSFSKRDANQDFLPLCHIRLNVEFTINLFVLKSALVRNSKDVWSLNQCPTVPRCISRESKFAQMPILGCRLGWVPVGQFSLATLRGTRARTFFSDPGRCTSKTCSQLAFQSISSPPGPTLQQSLVADVLGVSMTFRGAPINFETLSQK